MPQITWECHSSLTGKNKAAPGTQQTGLLQMAKLIQQNISQTMPGMGGGTPLDQKSLPYLFLDQAGSIAVHLRAWPNLLKELHSDVDSSEVSKKYARRCPGSGARNLRNPEFDSYGICMVLLIMGKETSTFSNLPYIALADT